MLYGHTDFASRTDQASDGKAQMPPAGPYSDLACSGRCVSPLHRDVLLVGVLVVLVQPLRAKAWVRLPPQWKYTLPCI
jgi:hypothetical protein